MTDYEPGREKPEQSGDRPQTTDAASASTRTGGEPHGHPRDACGRFVGHDGKGSDEWTDTRTVQSLGLDVSCQPWCPGSDAADQDATLCLPCMADAVERGVVTDTATLTITAPPTDADTDAGSEAEATSQQRVATDGGRDRPACQNGQAGCCGPNGGDLPCYRCWTDRRPLTDGGQATLAAWEAEEITEKDDQ